MGKKNQPQEWDSHLSTNTKQEYLFWNQARLITESGKSDFDVSKYKPNMDYFCKNLATFTFYLVETVSKSALTIMCVIIQRRESWCQRICTALAIFSSLFLYIARQSNISHFSINLSFQLFLQWTKCVPSTAVLLKSIYHFIDSLRKKTLSLCPAHRVLHDHRAETLLKIFRKL